MTKTNVFLAYSVGTYDILSILKDQIIKRNCSWSFPLPECERQFKWRFSLGGDLGSSGENFCGSEKVAFSNIDDSTIATSDRAATCEPRPWYSDAPDRTRQHAIGSWVKRQLPCLDLC